MALLLTYVNTAILLPLSLFAYFFYKLYHQRTFYRRMVRVYDIVSAG